MSGLPASLTCPACGMITHSPTDVAEGYCGHCNEWTRHRVIVDFDPNDMPLPILQVFFAICRMLSGGCCPCTADICDCFEGIPYRAMRDVVHYVI